VNIKRAAIIVLVIAVFVLVSESEACVLEFDGRGGSSLSTEYGSIDLESVKTYSFTETEAGYTVFMQYDNGEEQTLDVVVDVEDVTVSGYWWTPLHKTMQIRYSGRAEWTDSLVEMTFEGHREDFTITGICSPLAAKRLARKQAVEEIEGMLEGHFDTVADYVQRESQAQMTAVSL
jgi:hypothetical protein